jgi:hypothetical protein
MLENNIAPSKFPFISIADHIRKATGFDQLRDLVLSGMIRIAGERGDDFSCNFDADSLPHELLQHLNEHSAWMGVYLGILYKGESINIQDVTVDSIAEVIESFVQQGRVVVGGSDDQSYYRLSETQVNEILTCAKPLQYDAIKTIVH